MDELEKPSKQVRIYPSDYKAIMEEVNRRRTIIAQIIHEALLKKNEGEPESV